MISHKKNPNYPVVESKPYLAAVLALLLGGILFVSCTSTGGLQSYSRKTPGVDLKKYKTFAWAKPQDADAEGRKDDKIYGPLILQLSNDELVKKGFILDTEDPDAVFIFDTRLEQRVAYSQTPQVSVGFGFGGPGYYGGFAAPVAGGQVVQENYVEGMLFIEMYDRRSGQLLWKGWAQEQIDYRNDVESDVRTAVKHIFMRLPVKHSK
jgi:hypothetical protein